MLDPIHSAARLDGVIDSLERGMVPEQQMFHLLYNDLVSTPMDVLESMYRHFGIELSTTERAAMQQYIDDNPRSARPAHKLSEAPDAAVQRARDAYRHYQEYFAVPNE